MVNITLVCSDKTHPVFEVLETWCQDNRGRFRVNLINKIDAIGEGGEILFLISCSEIVPANVRARFTHSLVIHASDLPAGRGWSPHIWQVLEGSQKLTVSLLEAEDAVDTGAIWRKTAVNLNGTELYDEINQLLFDAEIKLIEWACENYRTVQPIPQLAGESSYYRRRSPPDSELDISASMDSQFNLLRICDPHRFPVFFYRGGKRYILRIENYDE